MDKKIYLIGGHNHGKITKSDIYPEQEFITINYQLPESAVSLREPSDPSFSSEYYQIERAIYKSNAYTVGISGPLSTEDIHRHLKEMVDREEGEDYA